MSQLVVLAGLSLFVGVTLLLSLAGWFSRRPMLDRLRPYTPGGLRTETRTGILSVDSFRDVVAPLSQGIGSTLARFFGVSEELNVKLRRLHSTMDPTEFRTRQVGWTVWALIGTVLVAFALQLSPAIGLIGALLVPLFVFLVLEQQIVAASEKRQRRLFLELPVVAEQLGMLLAAGYSLGGAIHRIEERGNGVVAEDLRRVQLRMRQGLSEIQALREWADIAQVDALNRLIAVLALNREASNLGHLISSEARNIRREAHRELLAAIERKSQQVWIPVTVAALVPGSIMIAIPFIETLNTFAGA